MDDFDLIETPENVELQRKLAGIGSRFSAGVTDTLLMVLIGLVLFILTVLVIGADPLNIFGNAMDGGWDLVILLVVGFLLYWGYFVFFEMVMNGQSPGKRSTKIRVVKDGGGPITFTDVAIRNLLRVVDGLAFYGVAGVCMFVTKKVQRLGDLAAGTTVISEETHDYRANTDKRGKVQWEREVDAERLRASGLTPSEYRVLSNYWARREQLSLDARRQLLPRLVGPILQRLGRPRPNDSLEALEAEVFAWLSGAPRVTLVQPEIRQDQGGAV
ncbi:MAG: RDD family protein [Phycisphaerae bacterium]|nr:RDD family protein [Phycisphaerae bacterium]